MATEQTLNFSEPDRKELQQRLTVLGFNAGSPDGVLAITTRHAIVDWQKKHDLAPTGWLGPLQYAELKTESEVLYEQAMAAQPVGAPQIVTRHAVVVQEPRRVYVQQQPHYRQQDGGAAAGAAMMGAILGGALSGMSHHHSSPFGF